jgi:GDP-4-dehydro-6-deoxy-D-mannose reductase
MRVLITGITGFVGGHLADYLLAQGQYEVWGLCRRVGRLQPLLKNRVRELEADLSDREAVAQALAHAQPDRIFHLAGQPFVPESFRDPAATLSANTLGALHIFLALIDQQRQARVLVVGTNEEYGTLGEADLPISERTPLRPANPYGVSKAAQTLLAQQYAQSHGLDLICVRPFTHIGPRQNERFVSAAFARQIARIERGLQPPVLQVGNLDARRDFTDVRDMVRAYSMLVEHGTRGAVYNAGSGQAVTIRDLLDMLLEASSVAIEVRTNPDLMRPIDVPVVICDASALRNCTGWAPRIPLRQTLGDILDYWRAEVAHDRVLPPRD